MPGTLNQRRSGLRPLQCRRFRTQRATSVEVFDPVMTPDQVKPDSVSDSCIKIRVKQPFETSGSYWVGQTSTGSSVPGAVPEDAGLQKMFGNDEYGQEHYMDRVRRKCASGGKRNSVDKVNRILVEELVKIPFNEDQAKHKRNAQRTVPSEPDAPHPAERPTTPPKGKTRSHLSANGFCFKTLFFGRS